MELAIIGIVGTLVLARIFWLVSMHLRRVSRRAGVSIAVVQAMEVASDHERRLSKTARTRNGHSL